MSDPQRHDIFEDDSGTRVAVRQVLPPNALGISYVEYKNLADSNLRFLPTPEFMEKFKWVQNFDSVDTFTVTKSLEEGHNPSDSPDSKSNDSQDEGALPDGKSGEAEGTDEAGVPSTIPTRTQ